MTHISPVTIVLDLFGLATMTGGVIAMFRSGYLRENQRDAASLIDTQRKRIDDLIGTVARLQDSNDAMQKEVHQMSGELAAYKKLNYIEPQIITKLSNTMDTILRVLTKDGIHITTQQVDKQVIKESK